MVDPNRVGVTSRIHRAAGDVHVWRIDADRSFPLPVIVDLLNVDPETHDLVWRVAATVDLVDGRPAVTYLEVASSQGLDVTRLQREFRWATPLDIVGVLVPRLLANGIDPFDYAVPVSGYPAAADARRHSSAQLSDEFLREIAGEYLAHGRGYAAAAAERRQVSPRTVASWIEKARQRGILTEVPRGSYGGNLTTQDEPS